MPKPSDSSTRVVLPTRLACLSLLLVVVLLGFRQQIRAQYWETRLRLADSPGEQSYYLTLLSSSGSSAVSVARSLLEDSDAALRRVGAALLTYIDDDDAVVLLRSYIGDRDEAVRQLAVVGLARRRDDAVISVLQKWASSMDEQQALLAVSELVPFGCDVACATLCRTAREHLSAQVRAQAVEHLGRMRCGEAIPTLIEVLGDDSSYGGPTMLEQIDNEVLKLLAQQRSQTDAEALTVRHFETVSDQAALSLRLITGQAFGFESTDLPDRRNSARDAWRAWWLAHADD